MQEMVDDYNFKKLVYHASMCLLLDFESIVGMCTQFLFYVMLNSLVSLRFETYNHHIIHIFYLIPEHLLYKFL